MLGLGKTPSNKENGAMDRILQSDAAAKLPLKELIDELEMFLEPLSATLPEKRLRQVGRLAVRGIIGA
jgi:hypothetical protein